MMKISILTEKSRNSIDSYQMNRKKVKARGPGIDGSNQASTAVSFFKKNRRIPSRRKAHHFHRWLLVLLFSAHHRSKAEV